MKKLNLEMKVGLFFVVLFVLIAWISLKLGNYQLGETKGYVLAAVFPSSAGLNPESKVLMAGIRIGKVQDIRLEKGQALIMMKLKDAANIPNDSKISIQSLGFLGTKYLEIIPGHSTTMMADGDRFEDASGDTGLGAITGELADIAEDIKAITANLREVFGTEEGQQGIMEIFENLQRISTSMAEYMEDNQRNFNRLVGNLEQFTKNMAYLSSKNRDDLSKTMAAFPAIAENLRIISHNLAIVLDENNQEIGDSLKNLAAATDRLEVTMDSVASIAQKIDEGEGTIGKLVNDDETVESLNEAVSGINEFINRIRKVHSEVAYRGEYDLEAQDAKSYIDLTIMPRKDKFYQIGLVDDPSGRTKVTDTYTETVTNPGKDDQDKVVEEEHKEVTSDELKLTLQIGKRWHDVVFRGGLLESKAGVGLEYLLWEDHINPYVEVFDFSNDNNPNVKAGLNLMFLDHFLLTGGVDDMINKYDDPRFFVGGGIQITDDDLAVIFSSATLPDM